MTRKILLILAIVLLSIIAVDYFTGTSGVNTSKKEPEKVEEPLPLLEYGIPVDSFNVVEGQIRWGQTIGNLLESLNIKNEIVNKLTLISSDTFDSRKVKAGNKYKVFYTKDTSSTVAYLVYGHTAIDFYVFDFTDSLRIYPFQKEVTAVRKIEEAQINSSLWETMKSSGINPVLALDLSDVFAWTVDFFGLYPGDKFKVMYDELFIDSTSIGIGTIYAAWFDHRGEKYFALRFEQDSVDSYWDENGNSLRKSFLKAPLRFSRISSRYSGSRFHPVLKIYRPHTGVDYAAPAGTPVMAIGDGVIIEKGFNSAAGNYVKIRHNSVYTTGYNHLSRFGKGIQKGARVKQSDIIGYVGSTGYATGPHLDLRFWMNGKPVDPLKVKSPPVEPIKAEYLSQFNAVRDSLMGLLDSTKVVVGHPMANK
ncbi:MAG: peptidoglycan DD-metalloendopeptidase family protein [Bacteroidales bacterium]